MIFWKWKQAAGSGAHCSFRVTHTWQGYVAVGLTQEAKEVQAHSNVYWTSFKYWNEEEESNINHTVRKMLESKHSCVELETERWWVTVSFLVAANTVGCEGLVHGSRFLIAWTTRISAVRFGHQIYSRDWHGYLLGQADMLGLELLKCICPHINLVLCWRSLSPSLPTSRELPAAHYVMFLETTLIIY